MNDQIALVDLDDKIIGYETKAEVHRRGLLHRAFSEHLLFPSEIWGGAGGIRTQAHAGGDGVRL